MTSRSAIIAQEGAIYRLPAAADQLAARLCLCSACGVPVMRLSRCTTARVQRRSLAHQHEQMNSLIVMPFVWIL